MTHKKYINTKIKLEIVQVLDHKEQNQTPTTISESELMAEMLENLMQTIKESRRTISRIQKNKICKPPKLTIVESKINT